MALIADAVSRTKSRNHFFVVVAFLPLADANLLNVLEYLRAQKLSLNKLLCS